MIQRLRDDDYTVGIGTADDFSATQFTLKYLAIDHLVDFIATDDPYEAKPDN